MKRTRIVYITFVLIALCGALLLTGCSPAATATSEEVKVGKDTVPSLASVVGERALVEVTDTNDPNAFVSIQYEAGAVSLEDTQAYIDALAADGFVQTSETIKDGEREILQLATESAEEGSVVLVNVTYDPAGSRIEYIQTGAVLNRDTQ